MVEPGDRKPASSVDAQESPARGGDAAPRSFAAAVALSIAVMLLAAVAWALLHKILELGVGMLAVAVLGGWGIGATLRGARASSVLAAALAASAWLLGLIFSWMVALAILQSSSRTFLERLQNTSFLDWMAPQFGLLEIVGLIVYVAVAAYVARRRTAPSAAA
ncbi:MAG: hypothetical protein ACC726_02690 [Chloroflexota bacterium]